MKVVVENIASYTFTYYIGSNSTACHGRHVRSDSAHTYWIYLNVKNLNDIIDNGPNVKNLNDNDRVEKHVFDKWLEEQKQIEQILDSDCELPISKL